MSKYFFIGEHLKFNMNDDEHDQPEHDQAKGVVQFRVFSEMSPDIFYKEALPCGQ